MSQSSSNKPGNQSRKKKKTNEHPGTRQASSKYRQRRPERPVPEALHAGGGRREPHFVGGFPLRHPKSRK